jgi:uncharacterized protein YeaO (DUF488 family)
MRTERVAAAHAIQPFDLSATESPEYLGRGVRREDYARRNYFDLWAPELAPSASLVSWARTAPLTPRRWAAFERRYRREMRQAAAQHLLVLLAALSARTDLSVGCYCEDETRCHRSVLRELLREHGANVLVVRGTRERSGELPSKP